MCPPIGRSSTNERVRGEQVCDVADVFPALPAVLSRSQDFDWFPLALMSVGGELDDVADVLTSSGHGGRFSFGVITRKEAAAGASLH